MSTYLDFLIILFLSRVLFLRAFVVSCFMFFALYILCSSWFHISCFSLFMYFVLHGFFMRGFVFYVFLLFMYFVCGLSIAQVSFAQALWFILHSGFVVCPSLRLRGLSFAQASWFVLLGLQKKSPE